MNREDFSIKSQYMYGENDYKSQASSVNIDSNIFPHTSIPNLDEIMRGQSDVRKSTLLVSQKLIRPQFRVQFKNWRPSNFGDYIEYEMVVQVLEGSRQTWAISKRYTDFVKLNDELLPYFRLQLAKKSRQS